jgi:hypothetical protein
MTAPTVFATRPSAAAMRIGPACNASRNATMFAVVSGDVTRGIECGRELRSARPARPSQKVAADPFVNGLPADTELFSDLAGLMTRKRPPHEQQTAMNG